MRKKDLIFYIVIFVLIVSFSWQWISKGILVAKLNEQQKQLSEIQKHINQLQFLSGVGSLGSTHQHADIKVYINGQPIDFSQHKYQITTSFIHFEDGIGDVIHTHATGLTIGNLFNSVNIKFDKDCIVFEGQNYCSEGSKKLRFYVNGKLNDEFNNYVINDLDKFMISYGNEDESEIKKQINSVTDLAQKYSTSK